MTERNGNHALGPVEPLIVTVRNQKVILDADLARVYGVTTRRLNEQVRRNAERFPADFAFRLTPQEVMNLRSQIATSSLQPIDSENVVMNWSQFATSSSKHRGATYRPYAFTEHGAIMAATVLNSPQAVKMSLFVVRAFVKMREHLLSRTELEARLLQIENVLLAHDDRIRELFRQIQPLLLPPPDPPSKPIGFGVKERRARYTVRKPLGSGR